MGSIRTRKESGCLFIDFRYRNERCRELTALPDTSANRKRLEKILEKIDKADEMNCKKEEEYNSFCTNTREDWNEEQYQKLKREKILTEAAYLASLVELKAEVKNMLNQ